MSNRRDKADDSIPVYYFNDGQAVGWVVRPEVRTIALEDMTLDHLKNYPTVGFAQTTMSKREEALNIARAYVQNRETGLPGNRSASPSASNTLEAGYVSDDPLVASDGQSKRVSADVIEVRSGTL